MAQLPCIENAWLACEEGKIAEYGSMEDFPGISDWKDLQVLDATGKLVLPGFVDSHTHLVYAGNLGSALANYGGFTQRGFPVAALFDSDRKKVGLEVHGVRVHHTDDITSVAKELKVGIGVIATPASAAQDVADKLVAAGVGSILNFAPTVISVPEGVSLRKVDLALELQILSFYQEHRDVEG